jgi:hypothetical protein
MNTLRPILPIVALLAAVAAGGMARAADGDRTPAMLPVVVELFTSQGCSSCPPSDAFLGELSKRPDVIALAFHVDYWDYIGWADPFAKPGYTERQRGYAKSLHQRYVYTPEMVVSGMAHDSGMDRSTVLGLIDQARAQAGQRIPVTLTDGGVAGLSISVPALAQPANADVWLVTFDPQHKTQVTRGENRGHELTDYNVVRSLTLLARWDGTAAHWTVPPDRLGDADGVAVLVQHPDQGTMVGAAQLRRIGR